jgi:hypothetical protein
VIDRSKAPARPDNSSWIARRPQERDLEDRDLPRETADHGIVHASRS